MLFHSIEFPLFLALVFAGYWFVFARNLRLQNLFIVVVSYIFYGWWDWRFLILMTITSLWSFAGGLFIAQCGGIKGSPNAWKGRLHVALALIVNLGILGFFKYFDFFVDSAADLLAYFGLSVSRPSLQIILPVGISFYTFQALSYVIDVYRGMKPTRDVVAFLAFVSFFPQLVAGPIERASNLLPQFLVPRHFVYADAVSGCRQMLWGFFKKIVVADNCGHYADSLLGNSGSGGLAILTGVFLFSIQIYGDFSGYSDIAIGCAKLFGVKLKRNFNVPYFSRDIAEFWRRWHISLNTWFRDYLYIPLGGSRCGKWKRVRNTFAVFLISGLWHGANWTFVLWGAIHAICFLPLLLTNKNRRYTDNEWHWSQVPSILITFIIVVLGWTFFRAPDVTTAFSWLGSIFTFDAGETSLKITSKAIRHCLPWIIGMFAVEWLNRKEEFECVIWPKREVWRWVAYAALIWIIILMRGASQSFIYFQF